MSSSGSDRSRAQTPFRVSHRSRFQGELPRRRLRHSFFGLAPFSSLRSQLQSPQPRTPESLDELHKLIEAFLPYDIETLGSGPALVEKAGLKQYADVLGDGRPRQPESLRDRSGRHLAPAHELHDLEPGLVAQCTNFGQHRHYRFIPCKFFFTLENTYAKKR